MEISSHLGLPLVQSFACLEHKRHAAPAVVVDVQHHGRKGGRFGPRWHRGIVEVSWLNPMKVSAVLPHLESTCHSSKAITLQDFNFSMHVSMAVVQTSASQGISSNYILSLNECQNEAIQESLPRRH